MAEDQTQGKRFSLQSSGRLGARIGDQWSTQTQWSTQSTWVSDTSGVQSSGVFLPWISGVNNKVAPTNDFISGIQSGKIQSNIQLPWITDKTPTYPNATMTAMTPDEIDEMDKIAKKNGTYRESWNDIIHDEMLSNEYKQLLKQWVIQTWNDVRKYSYRKWAELVDYVTKHPYEALGKYGWMWWPFNIWGKLADKVVVDNNPVVKSAWNIASNKMWQWYYKYEDKINKNFEKWVDKNISKTLAEEYQNSGGIWESIKNWDTDNIKYWLVQWFSTSILPMTPWIIAWIATRNPYITAWVAFGSTAPIEDQEAYEEAIKEWATREQATDIWKYAWIINGALETVWEFLQIKWLLKPLKKNITKEITKKTGRQIIARWLKEYAQWVWSEALTEWTQEFVTNALIKTINENKDLFEWVLDSIIVWWALSAWPSTLWAWGKVMQDVQNNEIIDQKTDLEALDYVLEWEKRKAQRIEQQKEKMRQRANEKFQAQAWENAWLSDTNDYTEWRNVWGSKPASETTTEESVNTLDEGNVESDGSTFFSTDENWDYVVYDDGKWEQKIYAWSNSVTENGTKKSQFTELSDKTPYDPELEEYSKNFQRLVEKLSDPNVKGQDFVVIWRTEKGKEVRLSKQALKHIIEDHGKINVNTLLKAINKPSKQRWETKTDGKNRPYIVLDLWSKNKEFLVGLAPDSWTKNEDTAEYYTVTTSREAWAPKTPARDTHFQLKYEEEWYNPWVARKDEKNISWKSGKMLKDFLKWQTIEELAKKYWVERIDVVKWLVDGMAYGSYSNRILRLAEEIKESTAPHELLHLVFDMVDPETKTYLISQVMQSEWWSAEKAEEWLADSFSNFYRTGKIESAPKSTWGKIKIFFKRVRSFINGMWKWRNQLEQMFTDIIESSGIEELQGKIDSNKEINKSKAKMRKRFLEYRRNAEKTQIKTSDNNEKYQTVYHWSPYDFDKFDSANMWKWEWAQAHGWGHYVAINEDTWRRYAQMWWEPWTAWKWLSTEQLAEKYLRNNSTIEEDMAGKVASMIDYNKWDFEKWLKDVLDEKNRLLDYYNNMPSEEKKRWSEENLKKRIEVTQEEIKALKKLNKSDFEFKTNRNLYEVEIPDPIKKDTPTGSNYFEEDSFVENNAVDKIVKAVKDSWLEVWEREWNWKWIDKMVDGYNTEKGIHAKNMYHILKVVLWWDKQASKFLESLWYDWIHYFWGRDGEAYVIFNDDALEIKNHEKYQKAWDINSPAFKKRFGDSKVVDKNWNPLVVYHWTADKFTVFDRKFDGKNTWNNWLYGNWFYFTDDIETAKFYWGKRMDLPLSDYDNDFVKRDKAKWEKSNIMWVYLKMEKPFYWKSIKNANQVRKLMNLIHVRWLKWNDYLKEMRTIVDDEQAINFRKWLDNAGYDGIIYEWDNWNEYAVFYPNQIKSATDNVGTYDPNNDDIRYQRVYHWSPNEFGNFDSSHMWEGEWNQAHGRGHYVAVDPETARRYAQDKFYRNEIELKWRTMARVDDTRDIPYALRSLYRDIFNTFAMWYYDVEEEAKNVLDRTKKEYEETVEYYEELIKNKTKPSVDMTEEDLKVMQESREKALEEYKEALEFIEDLKPEDIKVREISDRRNFYEVEIPDPVKVDTPTGSNYLEEWATLKKSEINKLKKAYKEIKWEELDMLSSYRDKHIDWVDVYRSLEQALNSNKEASKFLEAIWYNGIHYYGWVDGEAYVIFNDNDLEIKNHEKYQKVEYEYDENGNRKWIKFEEDNGEFDPSIFWEPTREEQIADDKENEKNNPFYNAWIKYNNQNYKDDQLTFEEFIQWISERWDKEQAEYNKKLSDISEAQNDPQLLDLQLRAVKLMEEEWNVGKKFWKNVSKEVRDRQQKEVESKREQLISDIVDYMYPWLKTEEITYDMQKEADQKEAEREMLGREDLEEKLKYFKKDKNWNREAKEIKIENPDIKLEKLLSAWKFDEIFEPTDRVLKWKTPQWQHGTLDSVKDPKKFKSVMEKINNGTTKTKVTLTDVTQEARALEKQKAMEEAEKERRKKEQQEAKAKKKQEEYKKIVRMKAFQRLVDMQRFEKYPFLNEEEIKNRYGFTDEERKKITEQEEIKLPKKRWEKAISDLNKAVFDQVKVIRDGLERQNRMKQKDAEKNLWEIWEIDVDILLGRDEEKWQREVEEFEKIAEEEKKKSKKEKNKRLEQAREDVTQVEIDKERENSKSEKERVDKIIKSTKTDKTVRWSAKETATNVITPVSTRIRKISPKIYRELMRYFQNKDILTNERLKEIDPFLKAMGKIRKENPVRFMDIWVSLANRNIGYANGLLQEYGVKVPTKLLDTIFDEAEDVGLNINYLGSYYPLSVKAPKSFLEELMKVNKWDIASEIEKRIQEESKKKWWPLDESEVSAIINDVIAWEEKWPDVNTWNKHLKKRNTEIERTPKMLEYCDDPISTIIWYIEWMTQSIERAKFLGKSRSWNIHDLWDYVYNAKNGLMPDQQDELMELLKSVFNDESPNKFFQAWRDIATLTTLWSPSSTLTQLSDLSFSIYENGWRETLKAVWDIFASRKGFDLQDMWVVNRWEEYTNINSQKNLLQKAIHNVFTYGNFFSQFDTFWKSTFIQSTWRKRQKRAKIWESGDPQLRKDIQKWTDDEYMTDKIINDLKKWVFSEDVALVMYMKLWNIQPLTKAQMPKAYLDYPNRRIFYQFKTFGIKQLDYVLQETKENMKWWKNLSTTEKYLRVAQVASMIFIMTLMWVGASELKDISMRRRSNSLLLRWIFGENVWTEQIWDKISDSALQLFWLSRYTVMQAKSDPVDAILSLFTTVPATNIIEYPFRDILKAFKDDGSINWRNPSAYQLIPVIWKYRYWIYWWWQDKQQEALDKENKKKTTTSGWSSRSTRNTRSRSRNTRNSR